MDQPAQIVTQTPPAGGPPLASPPIQPPVFPKKASKIPLILVVVLIITVVGIGAFWLGRSLSEPKISVVPTPTVVPETQGFSCQTDSDCVLVRNIKQCCSCPQAVNKEELEKNKDLLKFPHLTLEMIPTPSGGCKDKICSPCPEWSKAICVSGICKEAAEDQVVVNETPAPTSSPDLTAGWRTYINKENGIEFKYPPEWEAKALPGWTLNVFLESHPFEIPKATEFMTSIQVEFNEVMNTITNEKYFQEKTLEEGTKRIESLYDPKTMTRSDLVVGGKKAVQISGLWGPGMLEGRYFKETLIQMEDKLLIVSLTNKEFEDIYNQILSTFKFLD